MNRRSFIQRLSGLIGVAAAAPLLSNNAVAADALEELAAHVNVDKTWVEGGLRWSIDYHSDKHMYCISVSDGNGYVADLIKTAEPTQKLKDLMVSRLRNL